MWCEVSLEENGGIGYSAFIIKHCTKELQQGNFNLVDPKYNLKEWVEIDLDIQEHFWLIFGKSVKGLYDPCI